jgi:hypothetical protein
VSSIAFCVISPLHTHTHTHAILAARGKLIHAVSTDSQQAVAVLGSICGISCTPQRIRIVNVMPTRSGMAMQAAASSDDC